MITIINYGLGNVQAFANLYKRLNIPAAIAKSAAEKLADQRRSFARDRAGNITQHFADEFAQTFLMGIVAGEVNSKEEITL